MHPGDGYYHCPVCDRKIDLEHGRCARCGWIEDLWDEEWPTEPGFYWFYGWRSTMYRWNIAGETKPQLELIEVRPPYKSEWPPSYNLYGTQNHLYPGEGAEGVWQLADLPVLPQNQGGGSDV